jgi:hypothetical protein
MSSSQPLQMVWWLVSRASGIVALVLISLSVVIGLAMAAKVLRRPSLKRAGARLHEHMALTGLAAIGVHGLALLGDNWLKPGWRGITVPFALSYRPGFTGIGIIAGYLAVLLGPSFYLRRQIGARRSRALHRPSMHSERVRTERRCGCAPWSWLRWRRSSTSWWCDCWARSVPPPGMRNAAGAPRRHTEIIGSIGWKSHPRRVDRRCGNPEARCGRLRPGPARIPRECFRRGPR